MWSIRLNAIGLAILAWVQVDPVSVLAVWNMLPPDARKILPPNFISIVGIIIFGLSMLARLVRQPKLEAKRNAIQP